VTDLKAFGALVSTARAALDQKATARA